MAYNKNVEKFRDSEYPMINGKVYMDHGGTTIYSKSLIDDFAKTMTSNLFGNPHSASDPAKLSGEMVDSIRAKTLAFFCADPEHFDLVFTANATASIKLVGDCFRDLASSDKSSTSFWYGYHKDAHTSLVGVRELCGGTHHCFTTDEEVEDWLAGYSPRRVAASNNSDSLGLFAYPGQSNMTGRRLPLSWIGKLRSSTKPSHRNTYSLLDAAALATTAQLDFSDPDLAPDFTALSFYKIFGFPDLGGLIVRKASGHILTNRNYFGGGTINHLTVIHQATVQRRDANIHDSLEDGTLPFHSIAALGCAINVHEKLYGSLAMRTISQHTSFLAYRLYMGMRAICHLDGRPLCVIYNDFGERCEYGDSVTQGATIAFNIIRSDGSYVEYSLVEQLANKNGIYLRSGGLCNAGGIASYLELRPWQMARAWSAGHRCGEKGSDVLNGKPLGVVRASLGAMSTISDVDRLLEFLVTTFIEDHELEQIVSVSQSETMSSRSKSTTSLRCVDGGCEIELSPTPPQARRMESLPNMRLRPKEIQQKSSFYIPRPLANITNYQHQPSLLAKRSESFRAKVRAENIKANATRSIGVKIKNVSILDQLEQKPVELKESTHLLKFWKKYRGLRSKKGHHRDDPESFSAVSDPGLLHI